MSWECADCKVGEQTFYVPVRVPPMMGTVLMTVHSTGDCTIDVPPTELRVLSANELSQWESGGEFSV